MKLTLKIWRQKNPNEKGAFVRYPVDDVDPEMSMLECLDVLNEIADSARRSPSGLRARLPRRHLRLLRLHDQWR